MQNIFLSATLVFGQSYFDCILIKQAHKLEDMQVVENVSCMKTPEILMRGQIIQNLLDGPHSTGSSKLPCFEFWVKHDTIKIMIVCKSFCAVLFPIETLLENYNLVSLT